MNTASNSPVSSQYQNVRNHQHCFDVTSPSNSDGNHYQSPVVSPGDWNVLSPSSAYNVISPQSNASFRGSPSSNGSREIRSSPPSTPPSSFHAPALPTELGNQDAMETLGKKSRTMETSNKRFFKKTSIDLEREKIASRRAQSMMLEMSRKKKREYGKASRQAFGKKEAKAYLVPTGIEGFATSSREKPKEPMIMEDFKGSVNDFKCEFDRDKEYRAKKHALRIITRLDNAA